MARRDAIHQMITSKKAPKPVGAYSQALKIKQAGEMLFVSGQIPIEVPSGKVFRGDIKRQAEIAFTHLKNIVEDAGFRMDELVKVTIYLTNLEHFEQVNTIYQKFLVGQNLPARAVVEVSKLPKEVDVEVDGIAVKRGMSTEELLAGAI
ncbi:MAG: Rid family detoxifying hydrolase [Myxococcota bacterium]